MLPVHGGDDGHVRDLSQIEKRLPVGEAETVRDAVLLLHGISAAVDRFRNRCNLKPVRHLCHDVRIGFAAGAGADENHFQLSFHGKILSLRQKAAARYTAGGVSCGILVSIRKVYHIFAKITNETDGGAGSWQRKFRAAQTPGGAGSGRHNGRAIHTMSHPYIEYSTNMKN